MTRSLFCERNVRVGKRGFTLIETMAAITILLISITGPLQIASNALYAAYYARDEITAYYLAVEGEEYIKNARDSLFIKDVFDPSSTNTDWFKYFGPCMPSVETVDFNGCYIDTTLDVNTNPTQAIRACDSTCPKISYAESSGFWGYDAISGGTPTKFTRKIQITPMYASSGYQDEARVDVTITWPSISLFGGDKSFHLTSLVSNWQRL